MPINVNKNELATCNKVSIVTFVYIKFWSK